ncbi:hypothetical protein TNCV_3924961 [Trichonephila clavipes]|nr:hypothetical protein TNCV_3924961 [Trichonephila clavipes]
MLIWAWGSKPDFAERALIFSVTPLDDPSIEQKGCAAFHSRRESITGESPTSFSEEDTVMPYSGFEPTRLQAEGHIYHTGWAA